MKRLIYGAAFVLVITASIPNNSAIARGRPPIPFSQPETPQAKPRLVPTVKKSIRGGDQNTSLRDKSLCNQYPPYTGVRNGTSPAPANGISGPVVPPECQL